jgi:hypothetical protein
LKRVMVILVWFVLSSAGTIAAAEDTLFFEEQFNGPTLDSSIWRTEILTAGPRWCDSVPGWVWEGSWVDEGSTCYGVSAHSPYGTPYLSNGMFNLSPTYGVACPYLVSRRPGTVQIFPPDGDFTMTIRMRFDPDTGYGTGVFVEQQDSTEPVGDNAPSIRSNILLEIWTTIIATSIGSTHEVVIAQIDRPTEMHDYGLVCVGNSYSITFDGAVIFGPVTSSLRPTVIWLGHPALAYWGWSNWTPSHVDDIRVSVPGPTPVNTTSWGRIKATFR